MKSYFTGALVTALLLLALAVPAAADPPTEIQFEFVFDDVNPCTGLVHMVTIAGTTFAFLATVRTRSSTTDWS